MEPQAFSYAARKYSSTNTTDASTFTITPADVGSPAVRPGITAQLEQERAALLLTAKLVLVGVRAGKGSLPQPYIEALESVIRMAEIKVVVP